MSKNRKIIFDLVLISLLLAVGISSVLIINSRKRPGNTVEVIVDGEVAAEYPLNVDGEYSINGGTNILAVENGAAYIKSATCPGHPPEKRCTNQPAISKTLEKIVCLPNKVYITIK